MLITETWEKLSKDSSRLPKSAMDRFGFGGESYEVDKKEEAIDGVKGDDFRITSQNFQSAATVRFRKAFRDYCNRYSTFLGEKIR